MKINNLIYKPIIHVICYFLVIIFITNASLMASNIANVNTDEKNNPIENESDINKQLHDYKSVSKWIVDNQESFKEVLKETGKTSSTKWVVNISKEANPNLESHQEIPNNVEPSTLSNTLVNSNNATTVYHTVTKGETLYSIAKNYNITPQELSQLNSISLNKTIFIGQKLLIKKANEQNNIMPNTLAPINNNIEYNTFENGAFKYPKYKYYQVQNGDTLYSISRAVGMSPNDLIAINDLEKQRIYPGMILKINAYYQKIQHDMKFNWPLVGRLLISFGPQKSGMISEGINIMARKGSQVKSAADGVVIYVGNGVKALGNLVLIQHQNGWVSVYGYLENINVKKGDEVKQGDVIAKVGKPSNLKIPQLHFELRQNVTAKDPLEYLNSYT